MAVKAVCIVNAVAHSSTGGLFHAILSYAGIESGNQVTSSLTLLDISPTISAATLEANLKQAVKDELTNNHGYSFGFLDTVRLIGALL